jgi:26S proteasome regulatory subunit T5
MSRGTGKTLLARACAAQTKACYLKLAGPSLVQMFIGDGAKLVRDAFELAKEKAPAIIFIDELDAIGTKRFDSEKSGDREVQRTMLELLNQLDGFSSDERIKVGNARLFISPFLNKLPAGHCSNK